MAKKNVKAVQKDIAYAAEAPQQNTCATCIFHREHNGQMQCEYEYTCTKTRTNITADMTCASYAAKQEDAKCCANCRYACPINEDGSLINCAFRADVKGNPAFTDWCCRMFEHK